MPASISTSSLPTAIEHAVAERSLLQHPFYLAWSRGELTEEQLTGYAKEYYHLARSVPAVMEAIAENLPTDASHRTRATFARQAEEEREHIELWERFASSLGVTGEELEHYEPTATVQEAVSAIVEAASQGFEEGVAAMYAFECELPAISESKIEGLRKFYGLSSENARAYFEEHLREEKHLCFWRELLRKFDGESMPSALAAARATVTAQNRVLDGVCERYCPGMGCACLR